MRHAIYFAAEAGSLFHQLGSAWLGRDAITDQIVKQPPIAGLREVAADPHRYGFHATLKPPFSLRAGVTRLELGDAAAALAARLDAVSNVRLDVQFLDGFLALVPSTSQHGLNALAGTCVKELDHFRAPVSESELKQRRSPGLTPRQESNLRDWGYPYVMEDSRFHMTLTRRLDETEASILEPAAKLHFSRVLHQPITVDALTIFTEREPGMDFVVEERFFLQPKLAARAAS